MVVVRNAAQRHELGSTKFPVGGDEYGEVESWWLRRVSKRHISRVRCDQRSIYRTASIRRNSVADSHQQVEVQGGLIMGFPSKQPDHVRVS